MKHECEKCGADITKLQKLGYTLKHGFKPICTDCLFPGYIMVDWDDIEICFKNDAKIYLYGQCNHTPILYGPFTVFSSENHELINSKGRRFINNKDAMIMEFDQTIIDKNEEKRYSKKI